MAPEARGRSRTVSSRDAAAGSFCGPGFTGAFPRLRGRAPHGGARHTFAVSSGHAVASRDPSGLNGAGWAEPVYPLRARTAAAVAASHTGAVPLFRVRIRDPSGLNDVERTV